MVDGPVRQVTVGRALFVSGALVVAAAIALRMYEAGLIQGRYDIGAPDWWEGSFGRILLILGAIVSLVVLGVAYLARRVRPGARRWLRNLLIVSVIACWTGYAAGWATAAVAGPATERWGTLQFVFGPPIGTSLRADVICASIIGERDTLAEIRPNEATVPVVHLRSPVDRTLSPAIIQLDEGASFVIPGLDPPSIGPYDWTVRTLEEQPDAGRILVTGQGSGGATGPPSIDVEVTWTCVPVS